MSTDPRDRSGLQRVLLLLVANVIVGIGLPLLIEQLTAADLDVYQGTVIAFLVVLTLTGVEALVRIEQVHSAKAREVELWNQRTSLDNIVADVRSGLHELVADESLRDSFYLDHYRRELELLRSRVQTTIARKEVLLDRHHIDSTEVLLSIYNSPHHTIFRATHVLSDVTDVFDVTYQVYFFSWLERLRSRKVRSLRRLFIYDDLSEFTQPNVRKLLAFHNNGAVPGLEARAILKGEVTRFKTDYQITDGVYDFGIFSDAYLYLGQTRRDENISGFFSRDKSQIQVYTNVFDGLWRSRVAQPVTDFVTDSINEDQLFDRTFTL